MICIPISFIETYRINKIRGYVKRGTKLGRCKFELFFTEKPFDNVIDFEPIYVIFVKLECKLVFIIRSQFPSEE